MSGASSSSHQAQGASGCRLGRQAEDHTHPGQSCSGPSPNGAASRLQHTGHVCTVGGAREMETITLLAWHPSQHPCKPHSEQCVKGRFATGTERCKKGAWLLGLASPWAICSWLTLYWGEPGLLPHRGSLAQMKKQNPPKGLEWGGT